MTFNIFRRAQLLKGGYPTGAGEPASGECAMYNSSGTPKFRISDGSDLVPVPVTKVMGAPTVTISASGATATITITAKDGLGATLAARCLLRVYTSLTAYGAASNDLGTLAATTGTILKEDTDDVLATVLTDANGVAVLTLVASADTDLAVMATVVGLVGASSVTAVNVP